MKKFNEWATEKNSTEIQTFYDENHVRTQLDDWINKLVGLCHDVPAEQRPSITEEIIKSIRTRMN